MRITEEVDAHAKKIHNHLFNFIEANPGTSIHGSLPCAAWSQWQKMNEHTLGKTYHGKLTERWRDSRTLLNKFLRIADLVVLFRGAISFEWPRFCAGWALPELQQFILRWELCSANVDGCAACLVSTEGRPIKKPWCFVTSHLQQALVLESFKCSHRSDEHQEAAGKETKLTEIYPMALATALFESIFPHSLRVPAMHCIPRMLEENIPKETEASGFVPSPCIWLEILEISARNREADGLDQAELLENIQMSCIRPASQCMERTHNIVVTKSLSREEIASCPELQKAIKKEAKRLLKRKTWDEDSAASRTT